MAKILVITGMHRSGTSMVAKYLQQCGVDIGDTLQPGDVGNPGGYYEDVDFLRFHLDLLAHLGLSTFPTSDLQLRAQIPETFRLRAKGILGRKVQARSWGWKDCRTSLFLDFWQEIIPNINVVFLLRHPISVVDSLLRRGTDPDITRRPAIAFRSWWLYNQRILRFYCGNETRCFLLDIGDLVDNPAAAFSAVLSKLNVELPLRDFNSVYSPGAFKERKYPRGIYLALRYSTETRRCLSLYHAMKELCDWPRLGRAST